MSYYVLMAVFAYTYPMKCRVHWQSSPVQSSFVDQCLRFWNTGCPVFGFFSICFCCTRLLRGIPEDCWKCAIICVSSTIIFRGRWKSQQPISIFGKPNGHLCSTRTSGESGGGVFPMFTQIAKFIGPTWGPPGSCRPQMGPMLAPWSLSGYVTINGPLKWATSQGLRIFAEYNFGKSILQYGSIISTACLNFVFFSELVKKNSYQINWNRIVLLSLHVFTFWIDSHAWAKCGIIPSIKTVWILLPRYDGAYHLCRCKEFPMFSN